MNFCWNAALKRLLKNRIPSTPRYAAQHRVPTPRALQHRVPVPTPRFTGLVKRRVDDIRKYLCEIDTFIIRKFLWIYNE
jgi:hypothetical protein